MISAIILLACAPRVLHSQSDLQVCLIVSHWIMLNDHSNLGFILFIYRWLYVLERRCNPYVAMDTVIQTPDLENNDEGLAQPFSGSQYGSQAPTA